MSSQDTNSMTRSTALLLTVYLKIKPSCSLASCAKNATYTSKTTQNELLLCIKEFMQDAIVKEVKGQNFGHYYGIQCDEVTDASNWEQLVSSSLCPLNAIPCLPQNIMDLTIEYKMCLFFSTLTAVSSVILKSIRRDGIEKVCLNAINLNIDNKW
jgi:hypothetical protein